MRVTGLHVLAEIHDCDKELLQDVHRLEALLKDTAGENGFVVEDSVFHRFSEDGISGVLIAPHANLSIHTWPESRKVAIDTVTCREDMDPLAPWESLAGKLKASHMTTKYNKREFDIGTAAVAAQ